MIIFRYKFLKKMKFIFLPYRTIIRIIFYNLNTLISFGNFSITEQENLGILMARISFLFDLDIFINKLKNI
jgi:hypothetical protein